MLPSLLDSVNTTNLYEQVTEQRDHEVGHVFWYETGTQIGLSNSRVSATSIQVSRGGGGDLRPIWAGHSLNFAGLEIDELIVVAMLHE